MKGVDLTYGVLAVLFIMASCSGENVPTVHILEHAEIDWEEKSPCAFVYPGFLGADTVLATVKYRGGMSRKYEKHSFSLELNQKKRLVNLPKEDDWILNASYIDKTFMRHKISYDLFNEMGVANKAANSGYVHLNVNGAYKGLYLIMEEVNAGMLDLNKEDSMAMLFKDPPIFSAERWIHVQDSTNYYQQKFPKISVSDKTYYIEAFRQFLFHSSNADFSKNISNWIDLANVIDWHLLLLFSNNGDGIMKNFYLYKVDADTPFRIAIWDYDHSFGRDGDGELNMMERALDCNRAVLLERLMAVEEIGYNTLLQNRWQYLRSEGIISVASFESKMDAIDAVIHTHIPQNEHRWPVNSKWYYDANTYAQELALMRVFVKKRILQLDQRFGVTL